MQRKNATWAQVLQYLGMIGNLCRWGIELVQSGGWRNGVLDYISHWGADVVLWVVLVFFLFLSKEAILSDTYFEENRNLGMWEAGRRNKREQLGNLTPSGERWQSYKYISINEYMMIAVRDISETERMRVGDLLMYWCREESQSSEGSSLGN